MRMEAVLVVVLLLFLLDERRNCEDGSDIYILEAPH